MANGYQRNPLFHWFSWWLKPYPLKRRNIRNQLLANSTTEEQVRSTTFTTAPKLIRKPPGRSCFFFLAGRSNFPVIYHQTCNNCHKTGHFASVCKQVAKDQGASRPAFHKPTLPDPRRAPFWWVEQEDHSYTLPEESIEYDNCFTLSDGQPPNTSTPTIAPPSDRGHFVLLLLDDPNASWSAQIPFQIHSAASC